MFYHNFWTDVPIFIFFFLERSCFPGGPVLNAVAIRPFKVCLFGLLNNCLGLKSSQNLPNETKLGYVFDASNLRLRTKKLWFLLKTIFWGPHQNLFWTFVHPFLLNQCSDFHVYFLLLLLLKISHFHDDTIVNSVTVRQFNVCLSVSLNTFLGG